MAGPTFVERGASYELWEWTALANTNVGAPLPVVGYNDLTFHMYGTPGAGGAVTMYGALNAHPATTDTGDPLEEEAGIPLILNAASPWGTTRNTPLTVWPNVTGGDGTTALNVRAVIRR